MIETMVIISDFLFSFAWNLGLIVSGILAVIGVVAVGICVLCVIVEAVFKIFI